MASTQPIPESGPVPDVEAAHVHLMTLYRAALGHADGLSFFVKRVDVDVPTAGKPLERLGRRAQRGATRICTLRYLVRLFVNGHVANRLKQLRKHYQWRQQTLPHQDPARDWFAERQQELDGLSQELPSIRRLMAAVRLLAGPATAALVIYLGGEDLWQAVFNANLTQLGTLALFAFFGVVYPSIPFSISFAYKRAVLLGGASHPTSDEKRADSADNVYAAENSLWSALGAKKKPEPLLDRWTTFVAVPLVLLEAVAAVTIDENRGVFIFGTILFGAAGVAGWLTDRRRRYR